MNCVRVPLSSSFLHINNLTRFHSNIALRLPHVFCANFPMLDGDLRRVGSLWMHPSKQRLELSREVGVRLSLCPRELKLCS